MSGLIGNGNSTSGILRRESAKCKTYNSLLMPGTSEYQGMGPKYLSWVRNPFKHLFPLSYILFFTQSHGQEKSSSHYDLFDFGVYLFYGHIPPSFSSTSSTDPPPLYSPSKSNSDGPTWRRIPPGRKVWSSGKSRLYLGGLASLQTRHCQG